MGGVSSAQGDFVTMTHAAIKATAALLLGGLAFAGPAWAVSPLTLNDAATLVIPVGDEENEEVWHDLRPDVTPPDAAVGKDGEAPKGYATEPPKEEGEGQGGGDVEQKELQEDGLEPK
jgi:hypothetical protein